MQKTIAAVFITTVIAGLPAAPAFAQYYDYKPSRKSVEVDLSVLGELPQQELDTSTHDTAQTIPSVQGVPLSPIAPAGTAAAQNDFPSPIVEKITQPQTLVAPAPAVPYAAQLPAAAAGMPAPANSSQPANNPTAMAGPTAAQRPIIKPSAQPAYVQAAVDDNIDGQDLPPENVTAQIKTTAPATPAPAVLKPPMAAAAQRVNAPLLKPAPTPLQPAPVLAAQKKEDASRSANHEPPRTAPGKAATTVKTAAVITPVVAAPVAPETLTADEKEIAPPPAPAASKIAEVAEDPSSPDIDGVQMASAAPAMVASIADAMISFNGNSSDLDDNAKAQMKSVIAHMNGNDGRLQVRAFATGEDGSKSSARRISLSRALSVRSYLMDNGIKPNRVDVRALGTETDKAPADRVDLQYQK